MRKEIILKIIKKTPGISYNEIVRESQLSNGVISHYIIKLTENGDIEREGTQRGKYFPRDISKKDRVLISILRNKTNNEIFKILIKKSESREWITARDISKIIKKSGSTVSVSLKILQKNNIIERIIMNENSKLTNDLGYVISNKVSWAKYFIEYNL
tara:strand:+ start:65 stop:535 length:471 start_codon:yes stop_codon:yes gene_type:complete